MNKFYTYAFLREDRTPYYIGKGTGNRIYSKHRRIKPPKDKSRTIFLKQNLTEAEAFRHEIYMINVFGRKDLGTGILINRTDGGEGFSGLYWSEQRKNSISKRFSKEVVLLSPELKLISSDNIGRFCEKYNLTSTCISRVSQGKQLLYKGWSHPSRPPFCKIFYIRNPEEKLFCFGDIDKFCNEHNLSKTNVYNVIIERRKSCKNGWHSIEYKFDQYKLLSPEGKIIIWNTGDRTFCRKNNLRKWLLVSLISGEIQQTNGWTLKNDASIQKHSPTHKTL